MSGPKEPNPPAKGQFLVYRSEDGTLKIDVRLQGETAWLTQAHMATLFQTTVPNVNMHLRNIFAEGELQADSVIQEFLITAADGKKYRTNHYNLDAIISVGYPRPRRRCEAPHGPDQLARRESPHGACHHRQQFHQTDQAGGDFDKAIKQLPPPPKRKQRGKK